MRFTNARPSPHPRSLVLIPGKKTCLNRCDGMPFPVSAHFYNHPMFLHARRHIDAAPSAFHRIGGILEEIFKRPSQKFPIDRNNRHIVQFLDKLHILWQARTQITRCFSHHIAHLIQSQFGRGANQTKARSDLVQPARIPIPFLPEYPSAFDCPVYPPLPPIRPSTTPTNRTVKTAACPTDGLFPAPSPPR